jgi:hypothetical protein
VLRSRGFTRCIPTNRSDTGVYPMAGFLGARSKIHVKDEDGICTDDPQKNPTRLYYGDPLVRTPDIERLPYRPRLLRRGLEAVTVTVLIGCGGEAAPPPPSRTSQTQPAQPPAPAQPRTIKWDGIDSGYQGTTMINPDGSRTQK